MHTGSRLIRMAIIGVAVTALGTSSVAAATRQVEATDAKAFSPRTASVGVGGAVHWFGTPGSTEEHSVRQDDGLFDSGTPAAGLDFSRRFSAGTFAYHCEKHGDQGMVGRVRVAPRLLARPRGLPFTVRWATASSNTGARFDVHYRVGRSRWKVWLNNSRAVGKVFGRRARPVRVRRGTRYTFRVRSVSGRAQSGFSPPRRFRAR